MASANEKRSRRPDGRWRDSDSIRFEPYNCRAYDHSGGRA